MCGVVGIYSNEDVFKDLYQGLLAIQHRGQDSAGVITYDGLFHVKKGNGLIQDIFTAENARRLKGTIGVGHTRYPTIGGGMGIAGIGNIFFFLLVLEKFTGTLAFPLKTCGNVLLTIFITHLIWREKLNRKEVMGLSFALLAIVFMNL